MSVQVSRSQLVTALRGQSMKLPKFDAIYAGWQSEVSPHLEWLRVEVNTHLKWVVLQRFDGVKAVIALKKLQAADFGLFGCYWWPKADKGGLRIMTFLVIWLFLWDDEIDCDVGELAFDFSKAQSYRDETLDFIRQSLDLQRTRVNFIPLNILISSFEAIGVELRSSCTYFQRQQLYDEIDLFVQACEIEQRRKLRSEMPSIQDYMECRMGTSAVGVCTASLECCHALQLPSAIFDSPDIKSIWDCTNILISVTNDIISLKKELADDTPDNLIPLLWLSTRTLDGALSTAIDMLEDAKAEFDAAASRLYSRFPPDSSDFNQLDGFIEACKANCTGNLCWSMRSKRYGLTPDQEYVSL